MKTTRDPRHQKRIRAIEDIFAWGFNQKPELKSELGKQIIKHLGAIDEEIKKAAPAWPIKQINQIDLAILRLAVFELIIAPQLHKHCVTLKKGDIMEKRTPFRVIVDEAVELAKMYGSESSPGFINGVLGNLITEYRLEDKND